MNKVDGIRKIKINNLKKKRDIILGMIGEDLDVPKAKRKKKKVIHKKEPTKNVLMDAVRQEKKKFGSEWVEDSPSRKIPESVKKRVVKKVTKKKAGKKKKGKKEIVKKTKKDSLSKKVRGLFGKNKFLKFFKKPKKIFFPDLRRIIRRIEEGFFIFSSLFVLGLFVYFFIVFAVTNYRLDNKATRFIFGNIPLPYYVSGDYFVNYFDFEDLKSVESSKGKDGGAEKRAKDNIKKSIAINNLRLKNYGNSISEIEEKFYMNEEVNMSNLSRIRKIKEAIDSGLSLPDASNKYGGTMNQVSIDLERVKEYEFGNSVANLEKNQVSNIVITPSGFYVFKCVGRNKKNIVLNYVLIKPNTVEEYLEEKTKNIELIRVF